MFGLEATDLVLLGVDGDAAGGDLVDADREPRVVVDGADEVLEFASRPRGGVNRERGVALLEVPGLNQAGNPEHVVAVEVGEQQVVHVEAGAEAHHLALGAFAAVEEEPLALAVHHDGAGRPTRRRDRAAGAEERHAESHARGWFRRG